MTTIADKVKAGPVFQFPVPRSNGRQLKARLHEGIARVRSEGYFGIPTIRDYFQLFIAEAEGRLNAGQEKLVEDIYEQPLEFAGNILLREGMQVRDFEHPQFGAQGDAYSIPRAHYQKAPTFPVRNAPVLSIAELDARLIQHWFGREISQIPAKVREKTVITLPRNGILTPVQVGRHVQGPFITYYIHSARPNSEGVTRGVTYE